MYHLGYGMEEVIETLLDYAIDHKLMSSMDRCYARNRLLHLLQVDASEASKKRVRYVHISELLQLLCDEAVEKGIIHNAITERDNFDSALMDCVMMRPSQVATMFYEHASVKDATDAFYAFSKASNYIRTQRIARNVSYHVDTDFGRIDITINCSKPEKDPRDIARAKTMVQSAYPTCVLCKENEGFYGNEQRDGRSNIRLIPLTLQEESWYLQYSPYVYYNEHCIVLSGEHVPMKTCKKTFLRLLEFVHQFPHYMLGANADLPLVGGSILSHDHYQGGAYSFAMTDALILDEYDCFSHMQVKMQRLYWPLSVIRLSSEDRKSLVEASNQILMLWRRYNDPACDIFAHTDQDHNTISVIARKRGNNYELDLVLRNNRTSDEYPYGIFHPHEEIHHIKKENIGIIEVMGLAVLPARLKDELKWIKEVLLHHDTTHWADLKPHAEWIAQLQKKTFTQETIDEVLRDEVGNIFLEGLKHCGVFKLDEQGKKGFHRFVEALSNMKEEMI